MSDKIAEIRKRHNAAPRRVRSHARIPDPSIDFTEAHEDRGWLLAEVDKLGAENEKLRAEIERLREALRWYADPRNHFPVERRSPGAPDPAVIFVEEPPIMLDGGERARRALEGKP